MNIILFSYDIFKGNTDTSFHLLYSLAREFENHYNLTSYAIKKGGVFEEGSEKRGNVEFIYNYGLVDSLEIQGQRLLHRRLRNYPQPFTSLPFKMFTLPDVAVVQLPFPVTALPYIRSRANVKIYFCVDLEADWHYGEKRNFYEQIRFLLQKKLCRESDVFIVHSRFAENILKNQLQKPAFLLPHGYHLELFEGVEASQSHSLKTRLNLEGKKVIAWTGSVEPDYREAFSLLYNSMPDILKEHPETRLLVVGGEKRFSDEWIVNIPRIPYSNIPSYLSIADLVVLPKYGNLLQRWSVHVVKVVEAFASGLPVITSPLGFADALPCDVFYPIRPASQKAVKDSIVNLLEDERLSRKIGRKGKEYAHKNLTWKSIAERFHELLRKI